jgi:hypothetical protein
MFKRWLLALRTTACNVFLVNPPAGVRGSRKTRMYNIALFPNLRAKATLVSVFPTAITGVKVRNQNIRANNNSCK